MSLLTLDQTTLFYWNLSNEYLKPNFSGPCDVADWTSKVSQGLELSNKHSDFTPSLTRSNASLATTATRPPASIALRTLALSNGIKVTGDEDDRLKEQGAFSDHDEARGAEWVAKKKSPLKGKVRLTSQVSILLL